MNFDDRALFEPFANNLPQDATCGIRKSDILNSESGGHFRQHIKKFRLDRLAPRPVSVLQQTWRRNFCATQKFARRVANDGSDHDAIKEHPASGSQNSAFQRHNPLAINRKASRIDTFDNPWVTGSKLQNVPIFEENGRDTLVLR
jgi:hypothetical protein